MLSDWSLERAGRISKPSEPPKIKTITENENVTSVSTSTRPDQDTTSTANSKTSVNLNTVHSAGMIIIGDEILNGYTADVNMQIAATSLGSIGIPLKRVSIVSDDLTEIINEVRYGI